MVTKVDKEKEVNFWPISCRHPLRAIPRSDDKCTISSTRV